MNDVKVRSRIANKRVDLKIRKRRHEIKACTAFQKSMQLLISCGGSAV